MNTAVIVTKIDPTLKKKARETAEAIGMPLSAVIKGLLKQFVNTKTVTFSVDNEIPNARTRKLMKRAEKNYRKGNHSPVFNTGEEAVAWLKKQGV